MTKDESREIVYGMPYKDWQAKYQKDASPEQKAAFEKASGKHFAYAQGVNVGALRADPYPPCSEFSV